MPDASLWQTNYEMVDGELVGFSQDMSELSMPADMHRNIDIAQLRGWITSEKCLEMYAAVNTGADYV